MQVRTIEAKKRDTNKKAKHLLEENVLPAVIYGPDIESTPIELDLVEIRKFINNVAETTPFEIKVNGESHHAFLKSIQRHKVKDSLIHLDFFVPAKGHRMEVNIPLKFEGEPAGIEKGGKFHVIHNEIPVSILPKDIIDEIVVDISGMDIDDHILIKDLEIPEGFRLRLEEDEVVAILEHPKLMAEAEVSEEGEDVEVETIKEQEGSEEETSEK